MCLPNCQKISLNFLCRVCLQKVKKWPGAWKKTNAYSLNYMYHKYIPRSISWLLVKFIFTYYIFIFIYSTRVPENISWLFYVFIYFTKFSWPCCTCIIVCIIQSHIPTPSTLLLHGQVIRAVLLLVRVPLEQVDLKLKTGKELNFSLHFRNGVVHFRIARSHYQYSRSCFLHLSCLMARRCSRYFVDLFQRSILMKQTVFEFSWIGPFHSFFRRQFGTGRHFFKAVKIQLPFKR